MFETIRIQNKQPCNLRYHNRRMNAARRSLFGCTDELRLEEIISVPAVLTEDLYKCRVLYGKSIFDVQFEIYSPRIIKTLQLVQADSIRYEFKFLDRSCFARLIRATHADDILIVKDGLLTDTSFANIVFFDGTRWITPSTPLLRGTRREYYVETGLIEESRLAVDDLARFSKAVLVNAMLDLETGPRIEIRNILPIIPDLEKKV